MAANIPPSRFRSYFRNFFREFPDFSIRLTHHAHERMREHGIRLPQIRSVLRRGAIVHVEQDIRGGEDKYRVAGRDADERDLEVVVILQETESGRVVVVTVIDTSDTGRSGRRRSGGSKPPKRGK